MFLLCKGTGETKNMLTNANATHTYIDLTMESELDRKPTSADELVKRTLDWSVIRSVNRKTTILTFLRFCDAEVGKGTSLSAMRSVTKMLSY